MASIINNIKLCILALFLFLALIASEARGVPRDLAFVRTRDSHCVLHGSPFLFNGFNAYWMMNVASDPTERCKVSEVQIILSQSPSTAGIMSRQSHAMNALSHLFSSNGPQGVMTMTLESEDRITTSNGGRKSIP